MASTQSVTTENKNRKYKKRLNRLTADLAANNGRADRDSLDANILNTAISAILLSNISLSIRHNRVGFYDLLCNQDTDTAGGLDFILGLAREKSGFDNDRLSGESTLAEHLEVASLGNVNYGGD